MINRAIHPLLLLVMMIGWGTTMAQVAPKKWWQVYSGDKECHLFVALARGIHEWRSTDGLAKTTKVATVDVEAICAKYVPLGIIDQHPKEPNSWRYWERAALRR